MNYIDNESLLKEIKIYFETNIRTEELGRMFLLLAKKYCERGSFSGYSREWKEDMIGDAVLTCTRYMHNFDVNVDKPNPFAYFSRIIHHSFVSHIIKQKIHSKIKDICYNNMDFIVTENKKNNDQEYFNVHGIDYQQIRGNKKRKKRRKK